MSEFPVSLKLYRYTVSYERQGYVLAGSADEAERTALIQDTPAGEVVVTVCDAVEVYEGQVPLHDLEDPVLLPDDNDDVTFWLEDQFYNDVMVSDVLEGVGGGFDDLDP